MENEHLAWLVNTLEKGEVPAVLSNVSFAVLLAEYRKVIYGNVEGQLHQILFGSVWASPVSNWAWVWTSARRWRRMQCKNAIQVMIDWLWATNDDLKNGLKNGATVLFMQMGELLQQGMCDQAERKIHFAPEQYTFLLGSGGMHKRNAHTEPRSLASGHIADWSALLVEGGIRPFVSSVITALYHEGNTTGIDRLMQCMCGT